VVEGEREPAGGQDAERGEIVRELAGFIAPELGLVRLEEIDPELDVPAGDRRAVGPAVGL